MPRGVPSITPLIHNSHFIEASELVICRIPSASALDAARNGKATATITILKRITLPLRTLHEGCVNLLFLSQLLNVLVNLEQHNQ